MRAATTHFINELVASAASTTTSARPGAPDRPGLMIARRCRYFWDTVPMLARDPKHIEDLDTTGPDHGADAAGYGCLRQELAAEVKLVRNW